MRLSIVLARPLGSLDQVGERRFGLLPGTGLETTVRVDEEERGRQDLEHSLETVLDFLLPRDTRGVDVVDTRADLVGVAVLLEGMQELHVTLRSFDRDDIGIETLDRGEDVIEVGVAEVRVGLKGVGNTSSRELERVNGPLEVTVPINASERQPFTDSRLVDLDGVDTGLLEVDNFIAEGQCELLGLHLTGNICTRERPVQDGDGAREHALHGFLADALGVRAPLDGHGSRTANIRDNDRGADVSGAVALNPSVLSEDKAVEKFTKVLHHVVTLRLAVDEEIEADPLLELNNEVDFLLDEVVILLLRDLAFGELSPSSTDLFSLRE